MGLCFKNLSALKEAIGEQREKALEEARESGYPFVRSRGTFLTTCDESGQCPPCPAADEPRWNRTWREISDLVARVDRDYPDVRAIIITGGYDGSEEFAFGDYEPWISSWEVVVWERE